MASNPQKRSYHHGNLREEALQEAARSVAESGMDGLSLRALAKKIGVSHAAIAYHFPDRHALLDAIAVEGFQRLNQAFRQASDAAADDRERLHAIGRAYVRFAVENPGHFRVMFGKELMGAPVSQAFRDSSAETFAALYEFLGRRDLAVFCWGIVHGLSNLMIFNLLPATMGVSDREVCRLVETALDRTVSAVFGPEIGPG